MPIYVDIPGCDKNHCGIKNHERVTIRGSAKVTRATKFLTLKGKGKWFLFSKDFDFSKYDSDVCAHIDHFCPLNGGETINMKLTIKVDAPFGGVVPTVTLRVVDDRGGNVFCAKTYIKVVS